MTPRQAAAIVGCHPQHIRNMVRAGLIKAKRKHYDFGYTLDISMAEATRFKNRPLDKRGWPRGKPRRRKAR